MFALHRLSNGCNRVPSAIRITRVGLRGGVVRRPFFAGKDSSRVPQRRGRRDGAPLQEFGRSGIDVAASRARIGHRVVSNLFILISITISIHAI